MSATAIPVELYLGPHDGKELEAPTPEPPPFIQLADPHTGQIVTYHDTTEIHPETGRCIYLFEGSPRAISRPA